MLEGELISHSVEKRDPAAFAHGAFSSARGGLKARGLTTTSYCYIRIGYF
jgi:hypothetical protein